MSQNSCSLILFFEREQAHKDCLLMLINLGREDYHKAQHYQAKLGIDMSTLWHKIWFNVFLNAKPEYIQIQFDTDANEGPPLGFLNGLFDCGLNAAAIEVFHSEQEEYTHNYFLKNKRVQKGLMEQHHPTYAQVFEDNFDASNEKDKSSTISIQTLINQEQQKKQSHKPLQKLAKVSRNTINAIFRTPKSE